MVNPIFVGTSGWTYDDWAGAFYPCTVRAADRLDYYASRFSTVEVNATFYRMPTATMIAAWNRKLPASFHLVVKGPQVVTHRKKLVDCDAAVRRFFDLVGQLKRLRVVLWQLPPSLHKDLDRLDAFLCALPKIQNAGGRVRHAVEFRHASWWDDETAERLRRIGAAFVAVSRPELPDTIYDTADFLYVRFHGLGPQPYQYDYAQDELVRWAARLKPWLTRRLYAFFNNDAAARAPRNAAQFRDLLVSAD